MRAGNLTVNRFRVFFQKAVCGEDILPATIRPSHTCDDCSAGQRLFHRPTLKVRDLGLDSAPRIIAPLGFQFEDRRGSDRRTYCPLLALEFPTAISFANKLSLLFYFATCFAA